MLAADPPGERPVHWTNFLACRDIDAERPGTIQLGRVVGRVAAAVQSRNRDKGIHGAAMALHIPTNTGRCLYGKRFACPTRAGADEPRGRFGDSEE